MSIEKLNEYIRNKNVNNSRAREAIYNLLLDSKECLSVAQMLTELSLSYPKKISHNTLYRHLNFFLDCGLVIVIQDDFKRSYYYIKDDSTMVFSICVKCKKISKLNFSNITDIDEFDSAEFITVHKLCSECR